MKALTERVDGVEEHFGQSIAHPYRWLDVKVHSDAKMAVWVLAQNGVTQAHLAELPGRSVALPGAGVMDLLRFDHFTCGPLCVREFGDPADGATSATRWVTRRYTTSSPARPTPLSR